MLSIDQTNEDGHITPFSFASSVYDGDYETRSPVMTPLALFSKSMRDMQRANSTSNIAKPKKPEVFVFPIAEGDEADTEDAVALAPSIAAESVNRSNDSDMPTEHVETIPSNKPPNSPIFGGKPLTNKLVTSPPAWPFANSPPNFLNTTVEIQQPTQPPVDSAAWLFANKPPSSSGLTVKSTIQDPWPFAKKLPINSGPILDAKRSTNMPAHEAWPFANKPPVDKLPFAHGKVNALPSEAWPFAKMPPSSDSPSHLVHEQSLVPGPLAIKPVASPIRSRIPPKPSSLGQITTAVTLHPQDRTPSPQTSDSNPTFYLLPPTPPLLQPKLKLLNLNKNTVRSMKLKPSPLILASNSKHAKHPSPLHAANESPQSGPVASLGGLFGSPPHYGKKSPLNSPGHVTRAPLSPLTSPLHHKKSPVSSPGYARKTPLSPALSPLTSPLRYKKSPVSSPGYARKTPLSPALSPPTSPRHGKKSSPHHVRTPLTGTKPPKLTSPLHVATTPPVSPLVHSSPLPNAKSPPSPPQFKGTSLLSPNMYAKETSLYHKRSPTATPLHGKRTPYATSPLSGRRSALDDILPTVSLEPGRFDVASIYSARSMISRGSLVAQKIAATKKLATKEVGA